METPEDRTPGDDEVPYSEVVTDPSGTEFYVQVVPELSVSGPTVMGTRSGPVTDGLLGLVNRVLATRAIKQRDTFIVQVTREGWSGPLVEQSEHGSMRAANDAAQGLAPCIQIGKFQKR